MTYKPYNHGNSLVENGLVWQHHEDPKMQPFIIKPQWRNIWGYGRILGKMVPLVYIEFIDFVIIVIKHCLLIH